LPDPENNNPKPKRYPRRIAIRLTRNLVLYYKQRTTSTTDHQNEQHGCAYNFYQHAKGEAWRKPIEFIGLIILFCYTTFAFFQVRAMHTANEEARTSFAVSQQPYVSLGDKDGTIAEFIEPKSSDEKVSVRIYFQNGGPSPALTPNVMIFPPIIIPSDMKIFGLPTKPSQHLLRYKDSGGSQLEGSGVGSIPPQSVYVFVIPDLLTSDQAESVKDGTAAMRIEGWMEYCDNLGEYSCRDFVIDTANPPRGIFSEWTDSDCAFM
jgi:hypothetical protein